MSSDTLIVGCSFVENLIYQPESPPKTINLNHFTIRGKSGSGNQAIAARVAWEVSNYSYKRVIVLWSGINRLDFPVGRALHDTFSKISDHEWYYPYYTELGDMIWYHSGGFLLSGCNDQCPVPVKDFFQNQYRGSTPRYLSDMTMMSVLTTQGLLESLQIPYKMSFIYDINYGYTESWIEPGCGPVVADSPLYAKINWDKFTKHTLFEWARERNLLCADNFHPSFEGMRAWFLEELAIDICS